MCQPADAVAQQHDGQKILLQAARAERPQAEHVGQAKAHKAEASSRAASVVPSARGQLSLTLLAHRHLPLELRRRVLCLRLARQMLVRTQPDHAS